MKKLLVEVSNIQNIEFLKSYGHITYVSKMLNYVEMETYENMIDTIKSLENVISVEFSREGDYKPFTACIL